ncbi:PPC domain-containing protein [Rubripirellula lacrimiformis]|nr:PPC domain-containing protein [Rubripirellula lacrimiformis]
MNVPVVPLMAVALAWCVGVAMPSATASFPVVRQLKPLGVVRGEESTVTFIGDRVGDAHTVLVDVPGIEIIEVKAIDGKSVSVKLKADAKLSPGLYPVRLVTKTGISNLRLIGVGAMPIVQEVEPNNDFAAPQSIQLNHTVEGVVDREDLDHYQIELKAGQRLTAEIEGIRLGYSINNQNILDPYIAILDEGRFEVATSDDSSLLQQDGVCSFQAEKDGMYTVVVRDSAFGGSSINGYRLHVGTFPRPVAAIPSGGVPGSVLKANMVSIDGSVTEASVQLPSETADQWGVVMEDESGISPSPNWIRVNDLPVVMETEPNDVYTTAPMFEAPAAFCGVIEKEGDYDCFSFECKKGQKFRVQCYARNILRSPLDALLNVFGPDNKTIQSSDDAGGMMDPFIEFTAPADGKHTIRIYDQLRGGSPIHHYRIEVTPADPTFELTLKELRRDEASVVSVPIGGYTAAMVTATRKGYNGEIHMELAGLPPGVTATPYPVPSGRAEIPVLFTAAADASHAASLFMIAGHGDEKNFSVMGKLSQQHKLMLGQNRRHMWSYDTQRAAMAVTEAAPFQIELVQPATPILRSGSKDLMVRVTRNEGFEDEIRIRTLYNPPGIGVNNSRKIEKGKSETLIPITANGSAAVGKWPLILVASYPGSNGTAEVTTPAIMLDVQESLFKYEFPRTAAETGTEASVSIAMEVLREHPGEAEVELVGLPNGVTSTQGVQKIAADTTTVTFPITVAADAKVGKHKTLVCISRVKVGEETIIQTTGTGELRIDKPLPPKVDAPKAEPKPAEKKPAAPAAPKPLSRLEQLRQLKNQ